MDKECITSWWPCFVFWQGSWGKIEVLDDNSDLLSVQMKTMSICSSIDCTTLGHCKTTASMCGPTILASSLHSIYQQASSNDHQVYTRINIRVLHGNSWMLYNTLGSGSNCQRKTSAEA